VARGWVNSDTVVGLGFAAFGALMLWLGAEYEMGTAVRMGPGYYPRLLSWLCIGLSAILIVRGRWTTAELPPGTKLRSVVAILSAIFIFAVLIERFGLVLAALSLVVLATLAREAVNWRRAVLLASLLTLFSVGLFVWGLGLPFSIGPR
jgi:hypothetical protein